MYCRYFIDDKADELLPYFEEAEKIMQKPNTTVFKRYDLRDRHSNRLYMLQLSKKGLHQMI